MATETSQTDALITAHTLNWVRSFIVAHNICPFARYELARPDMRIQVTRARKTREALSALEDECLWMEQHPQVETSLIVMPELFKSFESYLEFVAHAEDFLFDADYEGIYQLATFHPEYYFADSDPDDAANFTNRSPYPMLHLLRESSVEKAIAHYGDTQKIPERNIEHLTQMGRPAVEALRENCFKV